MSGHWILKGHEPVQVDDVLTWAEWFEKAERHVAEDHVGDVKISTVFLGIDHSFGQHGPPILFETMIFGGPHDDFQERYHTWAEAEAGHKRALDLVKNGGEKMNEGVTVRPMTEQDFKDLTEEHERLCPELPVRQDVIESLERYVQHGIEPGQFLLAVLENNLMEAFGRADSYNRASLFFILRYIYNELPGNCHGSPERVREFLKNRREEMRLGEK